MGKYIFVLIFCLWGTWNSDLSAKEKGCQDQYAAHMDLVHGDQTFIAQLAPKAHEISSYEITLFQKKLTKRFVNLKSLLKNCSPKSMGDAIAIYDFGVMKKDVFSNKDLRRIVMALTSYARYELTDYLDYYKKYISNEMIEKTRSQVAIDQLLLPSEIFFETSERDYDPNLFSLADGAINSTTSIVAGAARLWGVLSDRLKWREGKLKDNQIAKKLLLAELKPLDMIFETRTYVLSNYTIPGHWGHVAIWMGTKEELIEMGIWYKDYFAPFRPYIEMGKNILEIRKKGLNFQSIDTFLNLDEIAVTRIKNIHGRAEDIFLELNDQLDKKYDFKFDARSADKITCAELISFSYGDIKWHETKTLFQVSLRPDDLAIVTLDENSPAEFVLYLKGDLKRTEGFSSIDIDGWAKVFAKKKRDYAPIDKIYDEGE